MTFAAFFFLRSKQKISDYKFTLNSRVAKNLFKCLQSDIFNFLVNSYYNSAEVKSITHHVKVSSYSKRISLKGALLFPLFKQRTGEVPQRINSHLETIAHAPCRRKMAGFHVLCTEILNFFKLLTLIFCLFLNNVETIVNKVCIRSGGHRTSKIVKSKQSYSNGHLPYPCSF